MYTPRPEKEIDGAVDRIFEMDWPPPLMFLSPESVTRIPRPHQRRADPGAGTDSTLT
jgi:hypothetical protein